MSLYSSWKLFGLFNKHLASFLVSSQWQKSYKPLRKQCKICYCLSTKLEQSSMKRTSRCWVWCNISHSSRWFTSKSTRMLCKKSSGDSKEQHAPSRSSSPDLKTKNGPWILMTPTRDNSSTICKINRWNCSMMSRENCHIGEQIVLDLLMLVLALMLSVKLHKLNNKNDFVDKWMNYMISNIRINRLILLVTVNKRMNFCSIKFIIEFKIKYSKQGNSSDLVAYSGSFSNG